MSRVETDWIAGRCLVRWEDGRGAVIPIEDRWTVGYYDIINGPAPPQGKHHGDTFDVFDYERMEDELIESAKALLAREALREPGAEEAATPEGSQRAGWPPPMSDLASGSLRAEE